MHLAAKIMYSHNEKQLEFFLPFGGQLSPANRWVKLAGIIPWAEFETKYYKSLKGAGEGPPAKSARVALGSLLESFYALKVSCVNACEVVKLHMSGFYEILRCQKRHFGT